MTEPKVVVEVKPIYTSEALRQRIQGTVILELVVGADGVPTTVRVLGSLEPGLDARAIQAVSEWRFEPGRLAGTPVPVTVTIFLDFRIW